MAEPSRLIRGVLGSPQGSHSGTPVWFEVRYGILPEWFHWGITRKNSENLLLSKPVGHFLVRVSESRIGYTLSYRGHDRCKHFKIDLCSDGRYLIVGEQRRHNTLHDLVDFHHVTPIFRHKELLTVICPQSQSQRTDPAMVLFFENHPSMRFPNPDNSPSPPTRGTPGPAVVTPVPKTRRRYFRDALSKQRPNAPPLPPPNSDPASTPAYSVQESQGYSSAESSAMISSHIYEEFNEFHRMWGAAPGISTLGDPYHGSLHPVTECAGQNVPYEYLPPPAYSPGYV